MTVRSLITGEILRVEKAYDVAEVGEVFRSDHYRRPWRDYDERRGQG